MTTVAPEPNLIAEQSLEQDSWRFELFVPYRLASGKILDETFTLSPWDSEKDGDEPVQRTGREIWRIFCERGNAEWGMFGATLKLAGVPYCFSSTDEDRAPRNILKTMTRALADDSTSEDLRDLDVALMHQTNAALYFLEESHSSSGSTSWFFGIGRDAHRVVVREYVFQCGIGRLEDFFERKGAWPNMSKSQAVLDYRHFFSQCSAGPQWATKFALHNLPKEETSGNLLLGPSNDDVLLQLAAISQLQRTLEAQRAELERQGAFAREFMNMVVRRLDVGVLALLIVLAILAYSTLAIILR